MLRTKRPATWRQLVGVMIATNILVGCSSSDPATIGDGELITKQGATWYAGIWQGYIEAFTFGSGTDKFRVSLDEKGNGWLQAGTADEPPPATDPNTAWPPALVGMQAVYVNEQACYMADGIHYPTVGSRVDGKRIAFSVLLSDPFNSWCALQTPQPDGFGQYYCISSDQARSFSQRCNAIPPASDSTTMDCAKAALSMNVCTCDANSCTSDSHFGNILFDVTLDEQGKNLVGTMAFKCRNDAGNMIRATVHLTR